MEVSRPKPPPVKELKGGGCVWINFTKKKTKWNEFTESILLGRTNYMRKGGLY